MPLQQVQARALELAGVGRADVSRREAIDDPRRARKALVGELEGVNRKKQNKKKTEENSVLFLFLRVALAEVL